MFRNNKTYLSNPLSPFPTSHNSHHNHKFPFYLPHNSNYTKPYPQPSINNSLYINIHPFPISENYFNTPKIIYPNPLHYLSRIGIVLQRHKMEDSLAGLSCRAKRINFPIRESPIWETGIMVPVEGSSFIEMGYTFLVRESMFRHSGYTIPIVQL